MQDEYNIAVDPSVINQFDKESCEIFLFRLYEFFDKSKLVFLLLYYPQIDTEVKTIFNGDGGLRGYTSSKDLSEDEFLFIKNELGPKGKFYYKKIYESIENKTLQETFSYLYHIDSETCFMLYTQMLKVKYPDLREIFRSLLVTCKKDKTYIEDLAKEIRNEQTKRETIKSLGYENQDQVDFVDSLISGNISAKDSLEMTENKKIFSDIFGI